MLAMDCQIRKLEEESDDLRHRVATAASAEQAKRVAVEKRRDELGHELELMQAQLKSVEEAQKLDLLRAKEEARATAISEYIESRDFELRKLQFIEEFKLSAGCRQLMSDAVGDYKRSPELGEAFIGILTQVRMAGFTLGVDAARALWGDKAPPLDLSGLPDEQKGLYDLDAGNRADSLAEAFGFNVGGEEVEFEDSAEEDRVEILSIHTTPLPQEAPLMEVPSYAGSPPLSAETVMGNAPV